MRHDERPNTRDRNSRRRPEQRSPERIEDLFPDYLRQGYFDGDRLRGELLDRTRMDPLARTMAHAHPALTSHQIRRFFQHCRKIQSRLRAGFAWSEEEAEFRKIDAFAADARAKEKAPPIFEDFVRRNVAAVRGERDFTKGFMAHFEALLGFGARYFSRR
jgi:hypothetical protein